MYNFLSSSFTEGSLGNLTLTGYNSELSDRPFQEKKSMEGGFDDSPIRLNSYLRRISSWNEEQILVRAGQLAEKAKEIWRFPLLSPVVGGKAHRG